MQTPIGGRLVGAGIGIHFELADAVVDEMTPGVSGSAPVDQARPEFWTTPTVKMMPTTNMTTTTVMTSFSIR